MATDVIRKSRLLSTVTEDLGFCVAYVALSLLMVAVDTTLLGLGDPKFGPAAWDVYWPVWAICFSPAVIVAIVGRAMGRTVRPSSWVFYLVALVVILTAMQISFLLDLKWPIVTPGELVLCVGVYVLGKQGVKHDS